jgi:homoserine dehydrogenase
MATVFLLGFGKVGRELAKHLLTNETPLQLVGVANSKGTVLTEGPADKAQLLKLAETGGRLESHQSYLPGLTAPDNILAVKPDIVFIAIPPSYETGEPNRTIYYASIEAGINIVTADKTLLAREYNKLMAKALEAGVKIGYRATVAAGTPVIDVARALRYREVSRVRAVLNSTSNYILGLIEKGYTLEKAIEQSIRAGLAEPDPSIDLHGWDAGAKITIIANELGFQASISNVERTPITSKIIEDYKKAQGRLKQIALFDIEKHMLQVKPEIVLPGDPLYRAEGERNIIEFKVENEPIIIEGPAGPAWRTARVMITDALEIING